MSTPADPLREAIVGRFNVRGGRLVEWEFDNAADERPDGIYTLFAGPHPDHLGLRPAFATKPAEQTVSYAGTVHDGRLTVYANGDDVWSCAWPEHPTESAGKSPEAAGWVSVEDDLPGAYETCLAYGHGGPVITAFQFNDGTWANDVTQPFRDGAVTHWMRLPEPPDTQRSSHTAGSDEAKDRGAPPAGEKE